MNSAPPKRTLIRFALPSVDRDRSRRSLRQAPRLWRARNRASARDPGLPCRLAPAVGFSNEPPRRNKKPSGAVLGRVCGEADVEPALRAFAPMSRACGVEWPIAIHAFDDLFALAKHRTTHVLYTDTMPVRTRLLRSRKIPVKRSNKKFSRRGDFATPGPPRQRLVDPHGNMRLSPRWGMS